MKYPLKNLSGEDLKMFTILVGVGFGTSIFIQDVQTVIAYTDKEAMAHAQQLVASTGELNFEIKKVVLVKEFLKFIEQQVQQDFSDATPATAENVQPTIKLLNNLLKVSKTLFDSDTEQKVFEFAIKKIKKLYADIEVPKPLIK